MSGNQDRRTRCSAKTRSGNQCKNLARPGEHYCHVHQNLASQTAGQERESMQQLLQELEGLVTDLKSSVPEGGSTLEGIVSPEKLAQFFRENLDKVTPDVAKGIAATFQGATVEDLLDPETWKGMGYMLNYSLRFQAEQLKQRLLGDEPEE